MTPAIPQPTKSRGKHSVVPRSRWWGPVLVAFGLLPTVGVVWSASAQEDDPQQDEPASDPEQLVDKAKRQESRGMSSKKLLARRKHILAAIPSDNSVLINVTAREMPASPDILNLGRRSTGALQRCLSDNVDADIRESCAAYLGLLGDRRALGTLQAALEDWEVPVRKEVVQALYRMPDKSSFAPLLRLLHRKDEDPEVLASIIRTLGALSDPRAIPVLRNELRKRDQVPEDKDVSDGPTTGPDLRVSAFRALWRSRHLMAPATLVADVSYALRSGDEALQLSAIDAAAEMRSPQLVPALVPLMERQHPRVPNRAVHALGRIGDKAATTALLNLLPRVRESRLLNNIAFALERLDRNSFFRSIRQLVEHKQALIRLNAAFVVGDVKRPEGLELLQKSLEDPNDLVKTSAIVALGKVGSPQAIPLLEKFSDHPNAGMRQEAIYAIHRLSGGKRADLLHDKLFLSDRDSTRRRAAIELGKANDPRARDYLIACLESHRCQVDEVHDFLRKDKNQAVAGRLLLAWARDNRDLTPVISELRPAGTLNVATSVMESALAQGSLERAKPAIDLVGEFGDATTKSRLAPNTTSADTWLRLHALVALARLGETTADTALAQDFDNLPAAWLPGLVRIVSQVSEPAVRSRLAPELLKRQAGADIDIALAAAAIRLAWDPEGTIFRFLDALASKEVRERDLAESYIKDNRSEKVTWLLRRALARETRPTTRDRLRKILDGREPA